MFFVVFSCYDINDLSHVRVIELRQGAIEYIECCWRIDEGFNGLDTVAKTKCVINYCLYFLFVSSLTSGPRKLDEQVAPEWH